jgi:lipoprotein-releasing system ATP-binding protein
MLDQMSRQIIEIQNLNKIYQSGQHQLEVLKNVNLQINESDAICLLGPSGAGKSTLLQILGTLDRPTSGEIIVDGENLSKMDDDRLSQFRNEKMGFVFQFHHLIHELSALENVVLPCLLSGDDKEGAEKNALHWFEFLGIADRMNHYPNQLSGGELQRVSIARSLIKNPKILFADEPTGNLDSENSKKVQQLFFQLQKQLGLTLVVVTHDVEFAKQFSKIYRVQDGVVTLLT